MLDAMFTRRDLMTRAKEFHIQTAVPLSLFLSGKGY